MYDRVLYPTDGSEGADVVTDHAVAFAQRFDAPLHVLFAVDTSNIQATDAFATSNFESTYEALEAEGQARFDRVAERAADAGVEVTSSFLEGKPADTIVEAANETDLIVMGTHSRSGLDRILLGSTTEKVVRSAAVPVVAVPMAESGEPDEG